jgi:ferredoxin
VKVNVDMNLCQSNAQCCLAAPEVFELDDDAVLHWSAEPDEALRAKVEEAAAICPTQAITVE